jgi:branched-chain amino acid transport system substrate-binding protein
MVKAMLAAAIAVSAGPAWSQAKEVRVAMIAPMSGPWARQGELMKKGADMAIEDINRAGGIKSMGGARLRLLVVDAGDSAEKAKNAAQRLVAQETDVVGASGAWLSSFTLAVTEVTERAELPVLTLSYSDVITGRGYKYVFQTSPTGGAQAQGALPALLELAKIATGKPLKTIGIVMDNTAAPMSFVKPMREGGFDKLNLKLVVDETFTPPLADATSVVQKVRNSRPDVLLLLPTSVPDDKLVLEKLSEMGLGRGRLPVVSNGAHIGAPEMLRLVGKELMEGVMTVVANWGAKGQEKLIADFKQRTGEPWMTQDSISTYGDMWIFKEALETAGSADRKRVAEAMRNMDTTDGPAKFFPGGRLKFEQNGRRAGAGLLIVQWQNGEPLVVYPPAAALAKPNWSKQ